ncbi:helix-turn-helix domain-containing protein [Clostridium sp. KNHs214]|uniref:helix-turn-helix domain-containing protein n=1 Tax=Clostridium sp. KNHs214 TaxID=1540257 RepID=UPI000554D63C|nr:helix-turn-helix domain-containing protein [Clostridium sp. KNHs214]
MTNYTIIQNETITSYLSDKGFRLYSLLQSMCYAEKISCYPSQAYLACALRCSVRTIQRALTELRDNKLITVCRRGSTSNLYTLVRKKINNAVDRLKRAVKGKGEVDSNTLKDKDALKQGSNSKVHNMHNQKNYYNYKKSNTFNDYTQRQYDFNKLEQALLGTQGVTEFSDLLLE